MTGFDSWRTPGGQPLRKDHKNWLPPRRSPSWMDDLNDSVRSGASQRSTQVGSNEIVVGFTDSVANSPDKPYYTALNRRAAICLRLSPVNAPSIESLFPVNQKGANIHFHAYTKGYPILRTVLLLPTKEFLQFESPLILTNGDVQEFIIAALETEKVELHIGKTDDDRSLSLDCLAHRIRIVLGNALDALRPFDYPAEDDRIRDALDHMALDFPEFTDGLSDRTLVVLQPNEFASTIATVGMSFS